MAVIISQSPKWRLPQSWFVWTSDIQFTETENILIFNKQEPENYYFIINLFSSYYSFSVFELVDLSTNLPNFMDWAVTLWGEKDPRMHLSPQI